jgi:dihydrofolate reductase
LRLLFENNHNSCSSKKQGYRKINGEMPWHNKEEFKHFKNTTLAHPVIMGRKTFETPGFPLKNRLNIVLPGRMIIILFKK